MSGVEVPEDHLRYMCTGMHRPVCWACKKVSSAGFACRGPGSNASLATQPPMSGSVHLTLQEIPGPVLLDDRTGLGHLSRSMPGLFAQDGKLQCLPMAVAIRDITHTDRACPPCRPPGLLSQHSLLQCFL